MGSKFFSQINCFLIPCNTMYSTAIKLFIVSWMELYELMLATNIYMK